MKANYAVLVDFLEFIDQGRTYPLETLLERVLLKARQITHAEAGTIFIVRSEGGRRRLEPGSVQNDAVGMARRPLLMPVSKRSIAGYVAVTGETLFIDDLYAIPMDRPYRFRQNSDAASGYVSKTMLAFPLTNDDGEVVAVVQLINRRPPGSKRPQPFQKRHAALIAPVDHFAGRAIERGALADTIVRANEQLKAQQQTISALQFETEAAFKLSIQLLARAAELHDEVTGNHILRVNEYAYALARVAGQPSGWCDEIRYSAQLHDVGKMSVDAAVLRKKGDLDMTEWQEMQRHPQHGYEILRHSPRLAMAADIARCHHEKWDGSGYPAGLRGESIPLAARIVAVADVYDALRSARPYKPGLSHAQACRVLIEGDERTHPDEQFDPTLLSLFRTHHAAFDAIWTKLQDGAPPAE
jgi:HD-GYP domain-containing protein (c-di-GMP phosphodiesterase class II)